MNPRISTLTMFAIIVSVSLTPTARAAGPLAGWGSNGQGQINVPAGAFTVVDAGSYHSLAIRSNGTLRGWGYNADGQINVPAGTFTAVAASFYHSLAIRSNGTLAGWGYNGEGQIDVPAGTFTAVAAGWYHSLAIRSDGTLTGWGNNGNGQIEVPTGTFVAIAAGDYHSLAIRSFAIQIPAVSAWGLIAMTVLVLGAGASVLARRRATTRTIGGPSFPKYRCINEEGVNHVCKPCVG